MRKAPLLALALAIAFAVALLAWIRFAPLPPHLLDPARFQGTTIFDRNGVVLREGLASDGTRSAWIEPDELPPDVAHAILAAEDRRFYSHHGIDPRAIARAAWVNARAGQIRQGGSTITQQVAKLLLRNDRGRSRLARKLEEAIIAQRLEQQLTKDEILALYLNLAPFGRQLTGIRRASRGYFGVEPSQLTPAQAALLAALPQSPSRLDPLRHRERAMARQRRILERMHAEGWVSDEQLEIARAESLQIRTPEHSLLAAHVVTRLTGQYPHASTIVTTLDAALQRDVRGILRAHALTLEKHGAQNAAVVVLDNRNGEWLAWEGSGDYFDQQHGGAIDGALAPRQPGSAVKPFAYAAAFEAGDGPSTVLADVPSSFPTAEAGVVYRPRNYDQRFRGPILARRALAGSINVPAVHLTSKTGVSSFLRLLRAAGVTTLDRSVNHYGLGAVLGGGEVSLAELTTAYAMFANGGVKVEPELVLACRPECNEGPGRGDAYDAVAFRRRSESLFAAEANHDEHDSERRRHASASNAPPHPGPSLRSGRQRLISEESAYFIADILSDAEAREFIFGRGGSLELPFPVAVKTGTSQSFRDNWTIGFTREVTVGVWVGNFDRKELRNSSGVTGAAPVFHDVMLAAQKRVGGSVEPFGERSLLPRPKTLEARRICLLSGHAPTAACPAVGEELFRRSDPQPRCSWHHTRMTGDGTVQSIVDWPAELRAWADERGLTSRHVATASATARHSPEPSFAIANPPNGAVYLLDPTLRREYQTLPLRASVTGAPREIVWSVNGSVVGRASSDGVFDLALQPGALLITARDTVSGRTETVRVVAR